MDKKQLEDLRNYVGKKVKVRYYSFLTIHHADDVLSIPQVHRYEKTGVLTGVGSSGIVVDGKSMPFFEEDDMMKKGKGVPVGVGYSTTGSGISLILYGEKVLYEGIDLERR